MGSMPACDPRGPSVNPALGKLVKQIFLSVSCIVDFLAKQYFNCCFSLRQSCYKENNTVHKLWYPHGHYIYRQSPIFSLVAKKQLSSLKAIIGHV